MLKLNANIDCLNLKNIVNVNIVKIVAKTIFQFQLL